MYKHFVIIILCCIPIFNLKATEKNKNQQSIEYYLQVSDSLMEDSIAISIIYAKEAYLMAKKKSDQENSIKALKILSYANQQIGQYNEAISYSLELLQLGDLMNDNKLIATAYMYIGSCYRLLLKFQEALNFHQLAIEKCQEIGDSAMLASAYNDMGATYFENSLFDDALNCFEKAHDIYRVNNDTINLARIYNSLGIIHGQLNNTIEAKRYFIKAIYIFKSKEMYSSVASIENNLAKLYIKSGEYKIAEEYLLKSYAYSSNKDLVQLQLNNLRVYVDLYKRENNYKKAFENLEKFISLHDSLKNETIIKKVEQIRMAYEVDKMEHDLMLAQKDNQLKSKNLRVSLFLSLGVFIIGILLIIVLIIKNRQSASKLLISQREKEISDLKISRVEDEKRLAKEKYEMELAFKNRELTSTTMHIVQKNELINDIRNHLSKMKLASKTNEKLVNDIIIEIDQSVIKDKDWELFVKHFKNVHPDFFDNLLKQHPDLTSKEVRYCAYSRLNLSLKEISAVLNITTRGVEKARSRIRQKMNLSKEIDLNTYLHSIDI